MLGGMTTRSSIVNPVFISIKRSSWWTARLKRTRNGVCARTRLRNGLSCAQAINNAAVHYTHGAARLSAALEVSLFAERTDDAILRTYSFFYNIFFFVYLSSDLSPVRSYCASYQPNGVRCRIDPISSSLWTTPQTQAFTELWYVLFLPLVSFLYPFAEVVLSSNHISDIYSCTSLFPSATKVKLTECLYRHGMFW